MNAYGCILMHRKAKPYSRVQPYSNDGCQWVLLVTAFVRYFGALLKRFSWGFVWNVGFLSSILPSLLPKLSHIPIQYMPPPFPPPPPPPELSVDGPAGPTTAAAVARTVRARIPQAPRRAVGPHGDGGPHGEGAPPFQAPRRAAPADGPGPWRNTT